MNIKIHVYTEDEVVDFTIKSLFNTTPEALDLAANSVYEKHPEFLENQTPFMVELTVPSIPSYHKKFEVVLNQTISAKFKNLTKRSQETVDE
jgi:hypothetical protein